MMFWFLGSFFDDRLGGATKIAKRTKVMAQNQDEQKAQEDIGAKSLLQLWEKTVGKGHFKPYDPMKSCDHMM